MRRLFSALTLAVVLAAPGGARGDAPAAHEDTPPDESFSQYVAGASRLEGRLLAPCCWDSSRQTLDIHGSPIANQLRREIRTRLRAGESADTIEADLVKRYTTKILAVPNDSPLPKMGPVLVVGLAVALGFAGRAVLRWRKRADEPGGAPKKAESSAPDEWDRKLDEELEDRD